MRNNGKAIGSCKRPSVIFWLPEHLILRKVKEARSCRLQLESVKEHQYLAREKFKSVELACAKADVRSKGNLARSLNECDLTM